MRAKRWVVIAGGLVIGGCTASLDLPPDTNPPVVAFSTPGNGATVSGVVGIKVEAADDYSVERVRVYIDGNLQGTFYLQPYYVQWNVTSLQTGTSHTLRAEAIDPSGNTGTAEITVTVQGGPS